MGPLCISKCLLSFDLLCNNLTIQGDININNKIIWKDR